jgi:diguanylate cyclase (GGDEF)-like protein
MPDDPHTTLKFRKVDPIRAPSEPSEPKTTGSSRPSQAPDWYADDVPTQRGLVVAIAAPSVTSSPDRALLTVLMGLNVGQVFTLDRSETLIGRSQDAEVHLEDVGVSRRHARIVRTEERRHILEDLGSTNGIFLNGRRVERADLSHGDRVQIGPSLVFRFGLIAADEEALARQLYEGSTRDALTGLFNRKYLSDRLAVEVAFANRHGTHLSVVLFDLDYFKRVNDSFGHVAGDLVLRVVAAQVQKAIRAEDVLARYGGEEFLVIVRGIEHRNVNVLADRIRRAVERLSIPWESRTLRATVSIGVASLSECPPKSMTEALVKLADERLYQAKAGGRNRVC